MPELRLFDFQEQAVTQLAEAAEDWVAAYAATGVRYHGRTPIPFLGHLKAVTGAGKTPILARACTELANAVVLWTSKSSAVVDQTYYNLQHRYRHLLPPDVQIIRNRPGKGEWELLLDRPRGLTIWVTTVGSWNEAEAAETGGSEAARLNMHRPHRDWGGENSPWEQLRSRARLQRNIWVVYDESHNQTPTQLDQLVGLKPVGFLMASATPPSNDLFDAFAKIIADDDEMAPISARGRVVVSTKDVAEAQLLKHTIAADNFDSDPDALLDACLSLHRELEQAASALGAAVHPKAIYVVESSNPVKGEVVARPVAIWEYLTSHGVPPREIAIYTQTKRVPDEAEKISALSELKQRHRHIICNRALQEGWDDPEAYIEYFDDESNSYVRIAQIIGRALRQPHASHFEDDRLNTASLFVRVANKRFDEIVAGLKRELSLYSTDDNDQYGSVPVRVRTKKDPLPDIPVKTRQRSLRVLNYQLGEADLSDEVRKLRAMARQEWSPEDLVAPGTRTTVVISLRGEEDEKRYQDLASNTRKRNGEFLRRRIQLRSRHCLHLLEPELFSGPAYEQRSCRGSVAQGMLAERAVNVVNQFERTVELVPVTIAGEESWTIPPYRPTNSEIIKFKRAAHAQYPENAFNSEERQFAEAIDELGKGYWTRNPVRGDGYGIQLPIKVGDSSTFYPDFLWWIKDECFAIDPTGRHILEEKIRGKLLAIENPKIILLTKGRLSDNWQTDDPEGWTMARRLAGRSPAPEHLDSLRKVAERIAALAGSH